MFKELSVEEFKRPSDAEFDREKAEAREAMGIGREGGAAGDESAAVAFARKILEENARLVSEFGETDKNYMPFAALMAIRQNPDLWQAYLAEGKR